MSYRYGVLGLLGFALAFSPLVGTAQQQKKQTQESKRTQQSSKQQPSRQQPRTQQQPRGQQQSTHTQQRQPQTATQGCLQTSRSSIARSHCLRAIQWSPLSTASRFTPAM